MTLDEDLACRRDLEQRIHQLVERLTRTVVHVERRCGCPDPAEREPLGRVADVPNLVEGKDAISKQTGKSNLFPGMVQLNEYAHPRKQRDEYHEADREDNEFEDRSTGRARQHERPDGADHRKLWLVAVRPMDLEPSDRQGLDQQRRTNGSHTGGHRGGATVPALDAMSEIRIA